MDDVLISENKKRGYGIFSGIDALPYGSEILKT